MSDRPTDRQPRLDLARSLALAALLLTVAAAFRCPGPEPAAVAGGGGAGGEATSGGGGETSIGGGGAGLGGAGGCDNVLNDPMNCGACGRACGLNGVDLPRCEAGVCSSWCTSGLVNLSRPPAPEPDDGCETPGRRVFVTQGPVPANFGGALSSDMGCSFIAEMSGLGGAWRAWTSDATTSPSDRFVQSDVPYYLLNGNKVASDWADLTDGTLASAINIGELGAPVVAVEVWTGTGVDGVGSAVDCAGWVTALASTNGGVGLSSEIDGRWTGAYEQFCDRDNVHLYCFEQ